MKLGFVAVLAVASSAAHAQDIGPYASALFDNMAISYYCRSAIGDAHYGSARTIAKLGLSQYVGEAQAVLYVDEMDQKFKSDPRAKNPEVNSAQCFQMKSDAMHRIDVEKAKLQK